MTRRQKRRLKWLGATAVVVAFIAYGASREKVDSLSVARHENPASQGVYDDIMRHNG